MNEPIGNRVKGLNPKLSQVTPHYLLSNSAGIRDFAAPVISNDDAALANMVRGWKGDVFFADQGEIYSYSSAGFWLSGFVIEDLYGKPYADAMTELLFTPLGMERTTLRPFMAITYPFATGHAVENGKPAILGKLFMKFDGKDYAMTKSGERKFTFGAQNENEVVFVPGKSGRIEFLFTELYGAKKIK